MKIIDEWKILSEVYGRKYIDDNDTIMWFNLLYKKYSKEKLILIKSRRFKKNKENEKFSSEDFEKVFQKRNWFINNKANKGEVSIEAIDSEHKIKQLAHNAGYLNDIISTDPRFLLLWSYNTSIAMDINVNSKFRFKYRCFEDFSKDFPEVNLKSRSFWTNFLSVFEVKTVNGKETILSPIANFGQAKLVKILKSNFDIKIMQSETKMSLNELEQRKSKVEELILEMV